MNEKASWLLLDDAENAPVIFFEAMKRFFIPPNCPVHTPDAAAIAVSPGSHHSIA